MTDLDPDVERALESVFHFDEPEHQLAPLRAVPPPVTADVDHLLAAVTALIRRFVVLPSDASYLALSLFVLHTWAFEAAYATPYLVIESPEKQSGKTRLLEVLDLVCRDPRKVASITAAALFQTVAKGHPTLLIDEADAIFGGNGERNEELRGVLNAGNVPGSPVIRGGQNGEPVSYDVFCPKVIAGIATGRLPDTVRDRSIVIPIDRKLKTEQVERLRHRLLRDELALLHAQLRGWSDAHLDVLGRYNLPSPLEQISDRLEEAWSHCSRSPTSQAASIQTGHARPHWSWPARVTMTRLRVTRC